MMSEVELPEGWLETDIGSVCELNPKDKIEDYLTVGFMPMSGMPTDFHGKLKYEVRTWHEVKKGYTQFKDGDILFAKITPCFENGKAAIISGFPNGLGSGSTEYYVLRPILNTVNPMFLLALLKTKVFLTHGASNMSGSVGHKRVPKTFVENYPLPLPPLAEQHEIAARLDTLLAQVDSIKARLDGVPAILKRFRQAVLAAAVSGRLTDSKKYSTSFISDIAQVIGGLTKNSKRNELGSVYPYLRVANVYENELRLDDISYIGVTDKELARVLLKNGDLLVVEGNGSIDQIGRVALWQDEVENCVHQNHLIKIRANNKFLNNKFLLYFMMSPQGKKQIVNRATSGAGLFTLSISKLSSISTPLPPLEEQAKIVLHVDTFFAFADQIEARVQAAQTHVNQLTQSILVKAFRGELTAEWRAQHPELISGENSTEALLKRIQAEREQTPKTAKTKTRQPKRAKGIQPIQVQPITETLKKVEHALSVQELLLQAGYPADAAGTEDWLLKG